MNQILQVQETKKQLKTISTKKFLIVIFITIIILALGVWGYYIYHNVINGNIKLPTFIQTPSNIVEPDDFVEEIPKPIIDLSVIGSNIKITITSEVELSEVKYKWNAENEKKENMTTYEDRNLFEKQLKIPMGQNTLTIVAIDVNGSTTEKVQEIKGVTKATTTTNITGEFLHFTVTGKENIEKVEFVFNGQKYLMNTETFGETKIVHYKVKLIQGMNYLTVKSTTQSGGVDVTSMEYKYTTE